MLDFAGLRQWIREQDYAPLFVTVSGAHLYGFPSPDSDIDLRGSHLLPLERVVGLHVSGETIERKGELAGIEIEAVSHDIGKYLRLLVKNNGYILEQVFSPLVVLGQDFLDQLRPLARRSITRHHYHHYRGFLATQRHLLLKENPRRVKPLLYAFRVLLTGIHLLRTGEVEANLARLAEEFGLGFVGDLIAQKTQEQAAAMAVDWPFCERMLDDLEVRLQQAYAESKLPEDRDREAVNRFLVETRLGSQ